ncbi:MAG: hypothetical protein AAFR45_11180, partial [Pseudomonadota bacterium]
MGSSFLWWGRGNPSDRLHEFLIGDRKSNGQRDHFGSKRVGQAHSIFAFAGPHQQLLRPTGPAEHTT